MKLLNKYGMSLNFTFSVKHSVISWLLVSTSLMHFYQSPFTYLTANPLRAGMVFYISWNLQTLSQTIQKVDPDD